MLSNQILQRTIHEIGDIVECSCSIWNMDAAMLAAVGAKKGWIQHAVEAFISEVQEVGCTAELVTDEIAVFPVCDELEPIYIFVIEHEDKLNGRVSGKLCVSQLEGLIRMNKERMDKNRFMQNLILDNLLLVDIYNQAKKMKIPVEQRRIVFLIEPKNEGDNLVLETLKGLFATGTKDFVTSVDEGHVILIKALENTDSYEQVNHISRMLVDTLNMEAMVGVRVSYGTIVEELKDVSRSYKEADMALEVGRVFYEERNILGYNELGIGRLIHQLPKSLCEMFLQEVFGGNVMEHFEEEELATVYTFFDNNLNISETARQLYVHRNTLVYRLEKIQKKTGLDVRKFDDALMFKIAMMVESHMRYMKGK